MSRPIAAMGCNFPALKEALITKDPHLNDQFFPENSLCFRYFFPFVDVSFGRCLGRVKSIENAFTGAQNLLVIFRSNCGIELTKD